MYFFYLERIQGLIARWNKEEFFDEEDVITAESFVSADVDFIAIKCPRVLYSTQMKQLMAFLIENDLEMCIFRRQDYFSIHIKEIAQ